MATPRVARAVRLHRRRAGSRRRDGSAALAAALGRRRRRGRPAPPGRCGAGCSTTAGRSAGGCSVPVRRRSRAGDRWPRRAGVDLIPTCPPSPPGSSRLDGRLVLGNYVYADGATNVRVSTAVDALTVRLQAARPDTALAFLATPTDVFAVPARSSTRSARAYAARRTAPRWSAARCGRCRGGRLLRRNYVPGAHPGISDSLVAAAGPELRPGQAAAAVAGDGGPGRRCDGVA